MTNPGVPPGPKGPEGDNNRKKWGYKREQFDAVITKTRFNGAFERLAAGEIDVPALLRVLDELNGASHQGRYMAEMLALKKESRRIVSLQFSPAVARFLIDASRRIPMLSDGLASQLAVTLASAADNPDYLDTVNSAVANLLLDLDHPLKPDTRNYLRALTDKIDATRKLQQARSHLSTIPSVYPPPSSEAEPRSVAGSAEAHAASAAEAPPTPADTPSPIVEITAPDEASPLEDPRNWTKSAIVEDEITVQRSSAVETVARAPERDAPSIVAIVAQHTGVSRDISGKCTRRSFERGRRGDDAFSGVCCVAYRRCQQRGFSWSFDADRFRDRQSAARADSEENRSITDEADADGAGALARGPSRRVVGGATASHPDEYVALAWIARGPRIDRGYRSCRVRVFVVEIQGPFSRGRQRAGGHECIDIECIGASSERDARCGRERLDTGSAHACSRDCDGPEWTACTIGAGEPSRAPERTCRARATVDRCSDSEGTAAARFSA
ncbi:MAG: hypothetical protein QM784_06320 [Polyangiaceae bacterium]